MFSKHQALEPFAVGCVAACSTAGLLTGNNVMSTNINTMPPAMPVMPDGTLVAKALRVINAQIMVDNIAVAVYRF